MESRLVVTARTTGLAVLLGAVGLACKPAPPPAPPIPLEKLSVVRAAASPLLSEIEDDDPPLRVARAGELVEVLKEIRPFRWHATMDGQPAQREGMLLELRFGPDDAHLFGFAGDLGEKIDVPTAGWICGRFAADAALPTASKLPSCTTTLRRIALAGGGLLAYVPCIQADCPLGILRDGRLTAAPFPDLGQVLPMPLRKRPLLINISRWVRADGAWTGGVLGVIDVSGDKARLVREIPLDEVDARDPAKVVARTVRYELDLANPETNEVRVVGERIETGRVDGQIVARAPILERHPLDASDAGH